MTAVLDPWLHGGPCRSSTSSTVPAVPTASSRGAVPGHDVCPGRARHRIMSSCSVRDGGGDLAVRPRESGAVLDRGLVRPEPHGIDVCRGNSRACSTDPQAVPDGRVLPMRGRLQRHRVAG
jgi:hypothetical protein